MRAVLPEIALNGQYNKVETARILGIGRSTLDKMIERGCIRTIKHRYTSRVSVRGSEIIRFFNAQS